MKLTGREKGGCWSLEGEVQVLRLSDWCLVAWSSQIPTDRSQIAEQGKEGEVADPERFSLFYRLKPFMLNDLIF